MTRAVNYITHDEVNSTLKDSSNSSRLTKVNTDGTPSVHSCRSTEKKCKNQGNSKEKPGFFFFFYYLGCHLLNVVVLMHSHI